MYHNGIKFDSFDEAEKRLNDYGCLHFKTPIICGISEPTYSEKELAELKQRDKQTFDIDGKRMTGYEASQAMRRIETAVREQKAIREAANNAGNKELAETCTKKIKAYQSKYNEISDITGIDKEPKRMSIPRGTNTIKSVDFSGDGGIINYRLKDRATNIHNESENGVFSFDDIEKDLSTSNVGKNVLKHIEDKGMFLNMNYDINAPEEIIGQIKGKNIDINVNNCADIEEVADTIIHEVAHSMYGWNTTQEDEVNCYILEISHRRNITNDDIKKVVEFVKTNYSYLPEGELYGY